MGSEPWMSGTSFTMPSSRSHSLTQRAGRVHGCHNFCSSQMIRQPVIAHEINRCTCHFCLALTRPAISSFRYRATQHACAYCHYAAPPRLMTLQCRDGHGRYRRDEGAALLDIFRARMSLRVRCRPGGLPQRGAVEHLHCVDGRVVAQHGRAAAGRVDVREHDKGGRLSQHLHVSRGFACEP